MAGEGLSLLTEENGGLGLYASPMAPDEGTQVCRQQPKVKIVNGIQLSFRTLLVCLSLSLFLMLGRQTGP